VAAAWPHLLGIFSGHYFHFFTKVWPALGGSTWLDPPKWFINRFGGKRASNIPGVDFRKNKDGSADVKGKGKKIKKGTGKKLGGAVRK
jgi:Derlin-1